MNGPSNTELDSIELESLYTDALLHSTPKRTRKPAEAPAQPASALYTDPANWTRGRGIALLHTETQTLLGSFIEMIHVSVRNCRRLVREDGLLRIDAVEEVSGLWWLGAEEQPAPRRPAYEQRRAVVHLHLAKLGVHAPAVELVAFCEYGGIRRVELACDTRFACESGTSLLDLPLGTNVLEVMDLPAKIALRKELGL